MRSIESLLSVLCKPDIVSLVFISADIAFCLPVKIQQLTVIIINSKVSIITFNTETKYFMHATNIHKTYDKLFLSLIFFIHEYKWASGNKLNKGQTS